ncbi:hypothetical protein E2C01_003231 [Portunus trituberculatus]|uniref:Uncharacterized protein n=1 Tax=Portunus trituberculatus TaxID=210409 RepID=A0A5B7CPN4_PORTR|nr:hypothetical protein [Portunus trituberculatus]
MGVKTRSGKREKFKSHPHILVFTSQVKELLTRPLAVQSLCPPILEDHVKLDTLIEMVWAEQIGAKLAEEGVAGRGGAGQGGVEQPVFG